MTTRPLKLTVCVCVCFSSAYLSVVGQVVGAVHELLQGAPRPVGALVAGGQLLGRGGPSIAHVQGGFPRGSPLHMAPLAEVSRHRVSQEGDVVELPVGEEKCVNPLVSMWWRCLQRFTAGQPEADVAVLNTRIFVVIVQLIGRTTHGEAEALGEGVDLSCR